MLTITETGLYRLMVWLSPAFPVGGFTYSHGIEFAVEEGLVMDAATLEGWVEAILTHGAGRVDAALFRTAWEAVTEADDESLAWAVCWAEAMRGSAETALESASQGRAFLDTVRAAWPHPRLDAYAARFAAMDRTPAHCVAVGAAAAVAGVPLKAALLAYLQAFAANLVSAGVRLVPLGQTDGQKILAALENPIVAAVENALGRPRSEIGSAAPFVDWTCMQHETQYTRLFRS